jgi:pantothenate kinase
VPRPRQSWTLLGVHQASFDALVTRARRLLDGRARVLLGICGAPGAGKSTFAGRLVEALGAEAVVVPMDGFHLHDDELRRLGRLDRKGAPDTFDVHGYRALLHRLRSEDAVVYAPAFDRDRELSLAGAIPVLPDHRWIVTEGNYLLLDAPGWRQVREELDECWFVGGDDEVRVSRLVARHVRHGRSPEAAQTWVEETDEPNARLVLGCRDRADLVVDLDHLAGG